MLLIGCRIDDVEVERPFQFFVGGVVDDDFDFRLIAFAQEARQVRAHHQLFDALRFASDGARFQIAGDGVYPDIPGGDGIGNFEFEGHGSVGAGEQMRLPESGFAEVAAQFDGRAWPRCCVLPSLLPIPHLPVSHHLGFADGTELALEHQTAAERSCASSNAIPLHIDSAAATLQRLLLPLRPSFSCPRPPMPYPSIKLKVILAENWRRRSAD